ncbi:MarR family winged helix-turn-helix transcriptional regulator [Pseudonocardia endophytica]|uniref:MarR family winged helix-turn-helix transcriptional regulator n=1 Tax=Pseudonocardia endophytica TaxID=401976 RepID=UPI00140446F6|nr:MarR family winged helix-turn-helix transcriptional regulator [Pseudonocardia endophytica]
MTASEGAGPLNRVLAQAERQVARQLEPVLAEDQLTVDRWRVLDLLADGEGHAMFAVATAIAVPGPSLTKIVDRLVDAALVYRLVDDRDRRRVLAFASSHGLETHARLAPRVAAVENAILETLGADADMLRQLLGQLTGVQDLQPSVEPVA